MNSVQRLRSTLAAYNGDGGLYLVAGIPAALACWVVPVLSLVALACGYRLFVATRHRVAGTVIGVLGGLGLLRLLFMLAAVL